MEKKSHKILYGALIGLFLASLVAFLGYIFTNGAWFWYTKIYVVLLLASTWYFFILLFLGDLKKDNYPAYAREKIWVIVPLYNERPTLARRALNSLVEARGNKRILIIDDGSTNGIASMLDNYANKNHLVQVHHFKRNQGKRQALHYAIKKMIPEEENGFVVTVDSDTVLDKDALVRVVEPLKKGSIGAATGDVRLINEKENWLTRMIGTYYWIGLHVYKKAQSSLGMVVCCSGCLSAYRVPLLKKIIDRFADQTFLGEKCTHSEDRHLTNLVLEMGLKVVFVPEGISYTETPATVKGFLKQQQRWKRGFIRESIYTLTHSWRTNPVLFLEILLWDLTIPFFTVGMKIVLLIILFTQPFFFLTSILPVWIYILVVKYTFVIFYAKDKVPGMFTYMFFYDLLLYWQNIYALFTVKNKSWITR